MQKLVLEQLHQEATLELRAVEELHKDRVEELQQIIRELEKKVVSLEKNNKNYDTLTGFVERNREIFSPTEQAIQFKSKEEQLKDEIDLLQLQMKRGKEN